MDSEARHIPSFPPFPNITEALFHPHGERNACVKSPALIASLTARVPFSHSKADLPSPFRQMHMPTATLPSSGEESNPLLKKKINTDSGQHNILPVDKKEKKKKPWQIISGLFARTWLSVSDRITWWMVVIRQIGQQSRRDWVDLERGGEDERSWGILNCWLLLAGAGGSEPFVWIVNIETKRLSLCVRCDLFKECFHHGESAHHTHSSKWMWGGGGGEKKKWLSHWN